MHKVLFRLNWACRSSLFRIERVAAGETYCSHGLVRSMFHRMAQAARENIGADEAACLTPRELQRD